ncbi:MAG TPA: methyltransferase, partial [Polyangiaceae bacterium]
WKAVERVLLVEVDPTAAALAQANLRANGWSGRAEVVTGDAAEAMRARRGEAQLVVCNPPYFPPGRGRPARGEARGRARAGELDGFVAAAREALGRRGRACFVYPARELLALLATLRTAGLETKRMRFVRAAAEDPARVVLVEAAPAKEGGLVVEPDLVEREGDHASPALARLVAGA